VFHLPLASFSDLHILDGECGDLVLIIAEFLGEISLVKGFPMLVYCESRSSYVGTFRRWRRSLDPAGLINSVYLATDNIDKDRKHLATDGLEHASRIFYEQGISTALETAKIKLAYNYLGCSKKKLGEMCHKGMK